MTNDELSIIACTKNRSSFTIHKSSLATPDTATGLVHLGGGRWYDPALGRPLQPNPVGGPPTVPQALNRYAATSVGPPGVAQGAVGGGNCLSYPLCGVTLNKTAGLGADTSTQKTIKALGLAGYGKSAEILNYQGFGRHYIQVAYPGQAGARLLGTNFEELGSRTYREIGTGRVVNLDDLEDIFRSFDPTGQQKGIIVVEEFLEGGIRQVDPSLLAKFGRSGVDKAFPFVVDAGFQLWQDWDNPYLTQERKIFRTGTAVLGGALGGAAAQGIATIIIGANPPALLVLGIGIVIGIGIEAPVVSAVNEAVFPAERKLKPLE